MGARLFLQRLAAFSLVSVVLLTSPWCIEARAAGEGNAGPRMQMRRTEEPPEIDGQLDDSVWQDAPFFRGLTQVDPVEGAPPSEDTIIKLLYDRNFLYLGVRCFDREPDEILATELVRDRPMWADDNFSVMLDTFLDERNGYHFALNPLGNKVDGLIENGTWKGEWDGIWYGKAAIDDEGWTAELAIPFKTISFDPNGTRWGFNFARDIRRRNELARLARATRSHSNVDMRGVAILEGLEGIEQGIGLDLKPSLSLRYTRDHEDQDNEFRAEPAIDMFYKLTPSLTGALTVNTDFADAEVDQRQINLTRFLIFYPEQRDFFLQDAGIFDFAGRRAGNALPFFSRRIGIAPDGEEIRILAGGKLTGRVGAANIGLLSVFMDEHDGVWMNDDGVPEDHELDRTSLSVGRVAFNVLQESTVGLIVTNGDPISNDNNTLLGSDFNYRNSEIFGDQVLTANLWVQNSFSEGVESRQAAFGAKLAYPNDRIDFALEAQEIQENYKPALGFADPFLLGTRQYDADFRYRIRPEGAIHTVDFGFDAMLRTDRSNHLESGRIGLKLLELANQLDDKVGFQLIAVKERPGWAFPIAGDVMILAGDYESIRGRIEFETANVRPANVTFSIEGGHFVYSGHSVAMTASLEWRPSRHALVVLEYNQSDVWRDEGDFTTRLVRVRLNLKFNTDLSWNTLAQYDNVTDWLDINTRLRWILDPGNEVFLVFNQRYDVDGSHWRPLSSELISKVGWTFRF